MTQYRTLDDVDVSGKRVLVRADLNVPLEGGIVKDTTRIDRISPTLQELVEKEAKIVVLSHLGRPKGTVVPGMSLAPVAGPLSVALDHPVKFVPTNWDDNCPFDAMAKARNGDILLMENTRFHPGEGQNQPAFVKKLMDLGDVYVNDAFSAAHRAHASTEGIAHFLPSVAGRAMEAELTALDKVLTNPGRPLTAVIGGSKISTKIDLLSMMVDLVDIMVIGGAMANTFLAAKGLPVGRSICETDLLQTAQDILHTAKEKNCDIILPIDVVVSEEFKPHALNRTIDVEEVTPKEMILDIGPKTVAKLGKVFESSKTIVWNGPLGAFEIPPFSAGTVSAARIVAEASKSGKLMSIAGGGDTVSALNAAGVAEDFTYVSTAGGAFLEWFEGKVLPGVAVLQD